MRKVDSEVYTVRRDLINPPELLLEDGAPFLLYGRMRYVRRDFVLSSKFQVMACSDR